MDWAKYVAAVQLHRVIHDHGKAEMESCEDRVVHRCHRVSLRGLQCRSRISSWEGNAVGLREGVSCGKQDSAAIRQVEAPHARAMQYSSLSAESWLWEARALSPSASSASFLLCIHFSW